MTRLGLVAVVGPVEIGRHHALEVSAVLLVVEATLDGAHALSVSVAFVGGVWRPLMERASLNRVCRFVGVDASAEHADELFDVVRMRSPNDIAIHGEVLLEEADFIVHVREEAAHLCGKVNHISWFHACKERLNFCLVGQTTVGLSRGEIKCDSRYKYSKNSFKTFPVLPVSEHFPGTIDAASSCSSISSTLISRAFVYLLDKLFNTVPDHAIGARD